MMKYVLNTRLEKNLDFILYQIIYEKILKITTKKKMIKENNIRIKKKQILEKDEREYLVLEYKEE